MISKFELEKYSSLRNGSLSCEQNAKHFLANIEKNNEKYNIFVEINSNLLHEAKNLDLKLKNGGKIGRLFGLIFSIKVNISVKGFFATCSSNTLKQYKASFDADVIKRIKEEDGLIIGIVGSDEFASGSTGNTSAHGKIINPLSPLRVPGGSSSGSAASVSADFCDISLGSDTGGSIRAPASHCGVSGIKPSYGRVSRYGLIDLSMSLDQIGPISKGTFFSALALEVISGKSIYDSTTENVPVDKLSTLHSDLPKSLTFARVKEFEDLIIDEEVKNVYFSRIEQLKKKGFLVKEISLKNVSLAVQTYYPLVYSEFFSGTRKFDGVKYGFKIEDNVKEEVLRRILGGKEISRSEFSGAYYKKALRMKKIIFEEFKDAFSNVDLIISPVTPKVPVNVSEKLSVEEEYNFDAFTIPANLAGICAGVVSNSVISLNSEKLSVGIQLMAPSFGEKKLVQGMFLLESLGDY